MDTNATTTAPARLMTVAQFAEAHPAFTVGALRNLLFFRETNGLDMAVRRVGRRLLIVEAAFFDWIEQTNPKKATAKSSPTRARKTAAA